MVYLTRKLDQIILTFGQFDHLVILNKLTSLHLIWLVVFFANHKMVFFIGQIGQKHWATQK
jgi:hypothetical protein